MALTVLDCLEHIRHRLGTTDDGSGLSHDLSGLDVVNFAGIWLMGAHRWKWAQRQSVALDTVSGQNYITLPADVETIFKVSVPSLTSAIRPASLSQLADLERNTAASSLVTYYAVEWNHTGSVPVAQLRIWPTPTSSVTGAFTAHYRAKWATRTDDNQSVFLPEFMHPLYIETCREYAMGWEEADQVNLGVRLAELQAGPLWRAARSTDGLVQPSYGVLTNGMADEPYGGGDRWRYFESEGPS